MFSRKTEMVTAADALPGATPRWWSTPPTSCSARRSSRRSLPGPRSLYVAMGCFWGAERIFWQIPGVHTTAVGYMGGWTKHPTYEETCTAPHRSHRERAGGVRPRAGAVRPADEGVLGEPRPHHAEPAGQRRRHPVPLGDLRHHARAARRGRGVARPVPGGAHRRGLRHDQPPRSHSRRAGDGVFYYAEDYHQGYLHKHPGGYCNHGFCQIGYDLDAHGQGAARAVLPDA